ncbi:hypothetical protein OPV22_015254 [Ensete ventricosum]|uniref:Uncharacterized protein n=1 Tax=Ensete ventricosum TaxID=4639 RepID=A0AAV8R546_ENSVE|nr:hypothetical protein OPV22_015254 [Ensete ventricosum]
MATAAVDAVQCFGRKKTAVAVAHCKRDRTGEAGDRRPEGLRAHPPPRAATVHGRRHPHPRKDLPDLCHPSEHRQGPRCLPTYHAICAISAAAVGHLDNVAVFSTFFIFL